MLLSLALAGCPPRPHSGPPSASVLVVLVPGAWPLSPEVSLAALLRTLVLLQARCQDRTEQGTAFIIARRGILAYLHSARHVLFPPACGGQLASALRLHGESVPLPETSHGGLLWGPL